MSGSTPATPDLLASLQKDLQQLHAGSLFFWRCFGLDTRHGGFHGTLDLSGTPVAPTEKGLVQQARHVWAFSTHHLLGYAAEPTLSKSIPDGEPLLLPTAQGMAQVAFSFMLQHMQDSSSGLWHWTVSREGQLVQPQKVLYGQWFVLYAFSQYHAAFQDSTAKELALKTFTAIDTLWHCPDCGGYQETPANSFPAESVGVGIGLKQQDPEAGLVRTFNTLLHGIEALTALHKVTADATVLQRLLELLDIVCTRLQRCNGLVCEEYTPAAGGAQWTPAPATHINYGHNLEASWLVLDTLEHLQGIQGIGSSTHSTYQAAAVSIGTSAAAAGYDTQHSGMFESGTAAAEGGPVSKIKCWWVEAEAMLAFWKLSQHFQSVGEDDRSRSFLVKLSETASFVRRHLMATPAGEQYWQVEADGTWRPTGNTDKDTLGNRWKASYHSSRAVLFLRKWVQEAAQQGLV